MPPSSAADSLLAEEAPEEADRGWKDERLGGLSRPARASRSRARSGEAVHRAGTGVPATASDEHCLTALGGERWPASNEHCLRRSNEPQSAGSAWAAPGAPSSSTAAGAAGASAPSLIVTLAGLAAWSSAD